jgi:hypothetical protein
MDIVSGTTARAPRNLLKGSRVELLQRVASVGFASVLLASAIFAIGAAVITKQTLQDVSTANVLNALYQEARYEVGAEESLERKYRRAQKSGRIIVPPNDLLKMLSVRSRPRAMQRTV